MHVTRMFQALVHSQKALHLFVSEIMNLTNIYDYTYTDNYLTNHEYICYLQQDSVRRGMVMLAYLKPEKNACFF